MAHEYKTHFVGPSGSGRVFCGIPRGNFPVTVVFETVTCRQCVRRYFCRGNVTTGRTVGKSPLLAAPYTRENFVASGDVYAAFARACRPMDAEGAKLALAAYRERFKGLYPYQMEALTVMGMDLSTRGDSAVLFWRDGQGKIYLDSIPSWPPWLPAQDEEA